MKQLWFTCHLGLQKDFVTTAVPFWWRFMKQLLQSVKLIDFVLTDTCTPAWSQKHANLADQVSKSMWDWTQSSRKTSASSLLLLTTSSSVQSDSGLLHVAANRLQGSDLYCWRPSMYKPRRFYFIYFNSIAGTKPMKKKKNIKRTIE